MFSFYCFLFISVLVVPSKCDFVLCSNGFPSQNPSVTCNNPESLTQEHEYHMITKRDVTEETNSTEPDTSVVNKVVESTSEPSYQSTTEKDYDYDPDSAGVNSQNATYDHHRYYQSILQSGSKSDEYWVDLNNNQSGEVVLHKKLSNSHRRALMVNLSFEFPFYGHKLRNITIATGGFIYTGTFVHKWLAATQYIAPLMANFDTSTSSNATIKYYDNGTALTVQWENVMLKDYPQYGSFTFQVTLKAMGQIIFAYKHIPVNTSLINDHEHPVKIGLSDAYIVEKNVFFIRKKVIFEYHKIDTKEYNISNRTVIIFDPVANCVQYQSCESCLSAKISFQCKWCHKVGRCSDSVDRHRQDWLEAGCDIDSIHNLHQCASLGPPIVPQKSATADLYPPQIEIINKSSHVGTVIAVMIFILIMIFAAWLYYAYYHPHTSSGQLLIRYRPSTWSIMRGGAKYTAATMHSIHM